MRLCKYIELKFNSKCNSNCKRINNADVDYEYNDVIDLGSKHRDYYVDIGIFSEIAELPTRFEASATSTQIQNKSP